LDEETADDGKDEEEFVAVGCRGGKTFDNGVLVCGRDGVEEIEEEEEDEVEERTRFRGNGWRGETSARRCM